MDMWKPFHNVTAARAPQAAILYDKFHVMRHLGDALDEVRKSEYPVFVKSCRAGGDRNATDYFEPHGIAPPHAYLRASSAPRLAELCWTARRSAQGTPPRRSSVYLRPSAC